jgi:hypothetical protein
MDQILRINLSDLSVRSEPVPAAWAGYGGRALTSTIVAPEVPATCHPLGPKNKLVFAPGLLAGTPAANSGRLSDRFLRTTRFGISPRKRSTRSGISNHHHALGRNGEFFHAAQGFRLKQDVEFSYAGSSQALRHLPQRKVYRTDAGFSSRDQHPEGSGGTWHRCVADWHGLCRLQTCGAGPGTS